MTRAIGGMQPCRQCSKPFPRSAKRYCSDECRRLKKVAANDPERRRWMRNYQLVARYGITQDDYEQMLERQDHKCAMCGSLDPCMGGRHPVACERNRNFHVDHDHETGKVRGLLCSGCNQKLGVVEKYGALAAAYLRKIEST